MHYSSGQPYGSYITPHHTGSKGGGSGAGMGGSRIDVKVFRGLHLDGNIVNLGGTASGLNSGGGSGGSIYIVTQNFSGHGLVDVTGGGGYGSGYGAAGGRIAVHVQWFKEYSGDLIAYGGFAGKDVLETDEARNGACGTVYTTDSNEIGLDKKEVIVTDGVVTYIDGYTYLLLDNDNRNHILATMVMSDYGNTPYQFEFSEVDANNHVVLWIEGADSELTVHKFNGDRTGLMHLTGSQRLYAEYKESASGYTVAPVSYKIDQGAEIILPSTTIILGTRTDMNGLLTNVQNLTVAEGADCMFTSTSRTALIEAGEYVHMTQPGNISLSYLTIHGGSILTFTEKPGSNLVLDLIKLRIKYEGLMWMNKGSIFSSSGVVESLGVLNIDYMGHSAENGPGAGASSSNFGYGGAHGGHGGAPEPYVGGTPHDSVYRPTHPGSGGGNGNGRGGRGGGYLRWELGEDLTVDGEITLEGEDGQSGDSGGGSGGGVFIETMNFTGFGHIDCHGGAGNGNGGGASGGRIAVHINFSNRFIGWLNVKGGLGTGSLPSGAAGTVYLQENARGPQYLDVKYDAETGKEIVTAAHSRLEINNDDIDKHLYVDHREPWLYTVLFEEDDKNYEFDEAMLEGHSNLLIEYPTATAIKPGSHQNWAVEVKIHKFHGDRTGVVRLRELQRLYVEIVESMSNETIAPCSFRIDSGSEVVMPTTTNLLGSRTVLAGLVSGVEDMMIRGGSSIFKSTGYTARYENRQKVMESQPGHFTFAVLRIMAGATAHFRNITEVCVIRVAEMYVKYQGLLYMNSVRIESAYAHIESQGELNMFGVGYGPELGPGAGSTLSDGTGLGAGHGGYGGGPGPAYGGVPYNSIYEPLEAGSGGGNGGGVGGSGGSYLEWNVGDLIEVNGYLTLAGTEGVGGNAGGGSGGSIVMHTFNITGHGVMAVNGGNGVGTGGGGSGGRISIKCMYRYSYGGKYLNYGGDGTGTNIGMHAGASGTIFKEENKRELEYRHKKYDPVHNTTFLDVDHKMLNSDNRLKYSPAPTLIQAPPLICYEFDELEITGSTYVWLWDPPAMNQVVELIAHKFIGDKTGQLHIRYMEDKRNKQRVWVEYVESVSNITEAPVSYILEHGSELVFPSEVHIHGTNSTFAGLVTGVHNLYIEDGAKVEFLSTANTSLLENCEDSESECAPPNCDYFRATKRGHFVWDQLHIKRNGYAGFLNVKFELLIDTSEIKVKYQGDLYMNHAKINSTYSWIESKGVFHMNGHGFPSEQGPGAGFTDTGVGYGAGHGGYGGGSDPTSAPEPYGSIFSPTVAGSGGGDGGGLGGSGGGILHWITSHYFEIQGLLALQGTDGTGTNAGGGSGGSLLIESMNFTGHGVIDTVGGDGTGTGGGGAGGRAAIHCEVT